MSTDTGEERREHVRATTVTSMAALFGVAAALISAWLTADIVASGDPDAISRAAKAQGPQLVVAMAALVQIPLVRLAGFYEDDEFGAKEALFIAFMTFAMWFVTWGILLVTGATI